MTKKKDDRKFSFKKPRSTIDAITRKILIDLEEKRKWLKFSFNIDKTYDKIID